MYMYINTHTHTHTHTHSYIYVFCRPQWRYCPPSKYDTYMSLCVCVCVCVYVYMYTHTHTHMHTFFSAGRCRDAGMRFPKGRRFLRGKWFLLLLYVYIYTHTYICLCTYIHIRTRTHMHILFRRPQWRCWNALLRRAARHVRRAFSPIYIYTHTYIYINTYTYIHINIYIYKWVNPINRCIHTFTQTIQIQREHGHTHIYI